MQSQDTFNREFDAATAAIERWLESLSDVAGIDRERTQGYWRVRMSPHERNGCPAELMLSRTQTFDIDVGPEGVANQPVAGFGMFLPLLQSIVAGHAVYRCWQAVATGVELTRELIVRMTDGGDWTIRRVVTAAGAATESTAVARDRVFLPYRR